MKPSWKTALDLIIDEGTAKSTKRAHQRDLKYFFSWLLISCHVEELYPVKLDYVMGFIVEHSGHMSDDVANELIRLKLKRKKGPLSPRSIRRIIGSLSAAHSVHGVENTCKHEQVRLVLKKLHVANSTPNKVKQPITHNILESMLATCKDDLRGHHDRALLSLGFSTGGRRRAELSAININDLEPIENGCFLHINRSKNDQEGKGTIVPVIGDTAIAVKTWLLVSGIREGALFRGIHRSGRLRSAINPDTINTIIKRRAVLAGLEPKKFSAHSLRSGYMTEAGRQGLNIRDAMVLSTHKDLRVASGYYRQADILNNPAAYLHNNDK